MPYGNSLKKPKRQGQAGDVRDEKSLRKEYNEIAVRRVKLGILLSNVARDNKLEVSQEEVTKSVLEQAKMYPGQEQKIFEFYRSNPENLQELRGPILEEKAVDFILETAKIKEVKVTIEELVKEDDEDDTSTKPKKSTKKPAAKKSTGSASKSTATKKPAAKKK